MKSGFVGFCSCWEWVSSPFAIYTSFAWFSSLSWVFDLAINWVLRPDRLGFCWLTASRSIRLFVDALLPPASPIFLFDSYLLESSFLTWLRVWIDCLGMVLASTCYLTSFSLTRSPSWSESWCESVSRPWPSSESLCYYSFNGFCWNSDLRFFFEPGIFITFSLFY